MKNNKKIKNMEKHLCLAFMFWLFIYRNCPSQKKSHNILPKDYKHDQNIHFNPTRNMLLGIYWFLYQPIDLDFTKQYLKHQHKKGIISVVFHAIFPLLATSSYDHTVILYNLTSSPPNMQHQLQDLCDSSGV